jgi:hypothetical protein
MNHAHRSTKGSRFRNYNLLVNLSGLVGYTGGHTLGNFSVTKQRGEQGTGVSAKIKDLQQGMKDYQVVLESGGQVIPGGHGAYAMAAKGLWDNEVTPGRTWMVTGMGCNVRSMEAGNATGGRGKTMNTTCFLALTDAEFELHCRDADPLGSRQPLLARL